MFWAALMPVLKAVVAKKLMDKASDSGDGEGQVASAPPPAEIPKAVPASAGDSSELQAYLEELRRRSGGI